MKYFSTFLISFYLLLSSCTSNKTDNTESVLNVVKGKIERLENFPSKHIAARHVDIWLHA